MSAPEPAVIPDAALPFRYLSFLKRELDCAATRLNMRNSGGHPQVLADPEVNVAAHGFWETCSDEEALQRARRILAVVKLDRV